MMAIPETKKAEVLSIKNCKPNDGDNDPIVVLLSVLKRYDMPGVRPAFVGNTLEIYYRKKYPHTEVILNWYEKTITVYRKG